MLTRAGARKEARERRFVGGGEKETKIRGRRRESRKGDHLSTINYKGTAPSEGGGRQKGMTKTVL